MFVVLSSTDFAKQLLEDWPWLPGNRSAYASGRIPTPASTDVTDAYKYGLRVTTKTRWEELRDEYLAYRTQLLNTVHEGGRQSGTSIQQKLGIAEPAPPPSVPNEPPRSEVPQDYPHGCLVFARNIHTETNKTTLRKLFSSAVGFSQDVLNYVDFNKGMDSVSLECFPAILVNSWAVTVFSTYQKSERSLHPRKTFQYPFTLAIDWFRRRRRCPFSVNENYRHGISRG